MSNSLRSAAESTVHMLSDLVDDARDRIEDLPHPSRRSRHPLLWWVIGVGALATVVLVVTARRRRRNAAEAMVDVNSPGR